MTTIQTIQTILGVKADDIWGAKSQEALNEQIDLTVDANDKIERIQKLLEVPADGRWGVISQGAFNSHLGQNGKVFSMKASSYADPADLVAFNKCKAKGKSDNECFKVGDNGIGQFGKITAQEKTSMVAVHKDRMIERWGTVNGAAHRPVEVTINNRTFQATVEDRISAPGRIDLNPACLKLAGLQAPLDPTPCTWKWL